MTLITHTPYRIRTTSRSSLEVTSSQKVIKFVNLPDIANIRIYSTSGILVDVVDHDDTGGGGEAVWNVRNRNNQFVASGVYFYHIETPNGLEKVGRFTVVNSSRYQHRRGPIN